MSRMITTRKGVTIICGARGSGKSIALSLLNMFHNLTNWEKEKLLAGGVSAETFLKLYLPAEYRRFYARYFETKPSIIKSLDVKKVNL